MSEGAEGDGVSLVLRAEQCLAGLDKRYTGLSRRTPGLFLLGQVADPDIFVGAKRKEQEMCTTLGHHTRGLYKVVNDVPAQMFQLNNNYGTVSFLRYLASR